MRHQATTLAAGLAVAAALLLGGCTEEPEEPAEIAVTGEPGALPTIEYEAPLTVEEPRVEVLWEGDGPEVSDGEPVLVDFYAESGADGTLINETYSAEPTPYLLSAEALGQDIYDALSGQTVGSRILQVVPAAEGQDGPTVAVFDLLPTRASGEPVEPREGLPTVERAPDGNPTVSVPDTEPPSDLVVQPLLRGSGRQVEPGQVITVQYTGVTWSDGTVFDSTWEPGNLPAPFPIGAGSVIEGWDVGLVEQTVGSQVLLVVPPNLAFGGTDNELADETLVFVIDILAASGGPNS